jgi:hypothetical protein
MKLAPPLMFVFSNSTFVEPGSVFTSICDECLTLTVEKPAWRIFCDALLVVDSVGQACEVARVEKAPAREKGLIAFLNRLVSNRVEVYIWLRAVRVVSLDELKQLLMAALENGKESYWEEAVGDIDLYRKSVTEAKSIRQLIEIRDDPWEKLGLMDEEDEK